MFSRKIFVNAKSSYNQCWYNDEVLNDNMKTKYQCSSELSRQSAAPFSNTELYTDVRFFYLLV